MQGTHIQDTNLLVQSTRLHVCFEDLIAGDLTQINFAQPHLQIGWSHPYLKKRFAFGSFTEF